MNTKKILTKILLTTIWLTAGAGLLVLLLAAIGKKNKQQCKDYVVTIRGAASDHIFIDKKDVIKMMTSAMNSKIKGESIASFNLRKLEQLLKDNVWIKDADLYFDNQDVLHVSVKEREPIARVFSSSGSSFYIDSSCKKMPLSEKISARVPVFTNFPDKKYLSDKDSLLLKDIKKTAWFILNDPFWMAQSEQVDIVQACGRNCWQFEMVPTVGNHIVKLGNGDDIEKKFNRLFVFYQQVMSKSGFNKYSVVDVQFTGQVLASKETMKKVDTVQLKKNIQELLNDARDMQRQAIALIPDEIEKPVGKQVTTAAQRPKAVMRARN